MSLVQAHLILTAVILQNYRDQLYDAVPIPKKKTLNTAEATVSSNIPTGKTVFPQYVEDKYEDLEVHTSCKFDPATSICATYLWTKCWVSNGFGHSHSI